MKTNLTHLRITAKETCHWTNHSAQESAKCFEHNFGLRFSRSKHTWLTRRPTKPTRPACQVCLYSVLATCSANAIARPSAHVPHASRIVQYVAHCSCTAQGCMICKCPPPSSTCKACVSFFFTSTLILLFVSFRTQYPGIKQFNVRVVVYTSCLNRVVVPCCSSHVSQAGIHDSFLVD
jgi:hypothetical protein